MLLIEKLDVLPASSTIANQSSHSARVALVSAMPLEREGLRLVLEDIGYSVVAVADLEAIGTACIAGAIPDLFVVDVPADGEPKEWLVHLVALRRQFGSSRIVLLSAHLAATWWSVCQNVVLDGYLSKACQAAVFKRQLDLVLAGERVFPFDIVRASLGATVTPHMRPGGSPAALSPTDMHILRYLVAGFGNKMIATRLRLAESTVKARMKSMCQRLHVANRTQAAIWALKHGIQPTDDRA